MAETVIWRPKQFSVLTDAQKQAKLRKDAEYQIAHLNLTTDYKQGKIDKKEFDIQHSKQWNDYMEWAKVEGLYEQVSLKQQLAEAGAPLNAQITEVNRIRQELGLKPIRVI